MISLISALTLMNKLSICIAVFAVLILAEVVALALLVKWKKNFKTMTSQKDEAVAQQEDSKDLDAKEVNDGSEEPVAQENQSQESETQESEAQENSQEELQDDNSQEKAETSQTDDAEENAQELENESAESVDEAVDVQEEAQEASEEEQSSLEQAQEAPIEEQPLQEEASDSADEDVEQEDKKDDKWSAFAFAPLMLLSATAQVTSIRYLLYALIGVAVVLGAAVLVTAIAFAKSLTKAPKQEQEPAQQPKQDAVEEQPVAEVVEEPIAEEVAEQPAEAAEETAQEVDETPESVEDSIVEDEATVEAVEDEPVEETVEEEPIQEESVEEAVEEPVVETVEEPIVEVVEEQPVEEVVEPVKKPEPVKRQPVPREQTVVVEDKTVLIKDDRFLFNPEEDGWYYVLEKTFTAKLIQAEDIVKDYYTELKNELLSYKKVHARMSKKRESFNFGRNCLVRMTIRGKTLRIHFALDAKDYEDTKYKVEDTSSVKSLADTPLMYRIKNDRRLKYAKDLIAAVMEKYGVEKMPFDPIYYNYADDLPYETTPPLIERGLIIKRRVRGKMPEDKGFDFAKKTFKAKLIQSDDTVKEYYSQLKNHLLSYRKIHDRMSKARESYRFGRICVARMSIRGKTLKLYLALDANDYVDSKYTIEDASSVKSVADTPLLIKIKNNRRLKHAMALIDDAMAKVGALKRLKVDETDYVADLPFEDTEELFEQGLIVNVHVNGNSFIAQRIAARQANNEAAADEDDDE